MVRTSISRRQALASIGAASTYGLAGCVEGIAGGGEGGDYPTKNITQVIPFGAGGGTDTLARSFNSFWEEELGTDFVIENRSGAGGRTGLNHAYSQPSDGYTIAVNDITNTIIPEYMYDTDYTTSEFVGIGAPAGWYVAWFAEPGSPWDNLADVAQSLKDGEELVVAHTGVATMAGLFNFNYLVEKLGAPKKNITDLPMDSGSQAVQAPATPDADIGVTLVTPSTVGFVEDGKVDVIFEARPDESPLVPDAATFANTDLDASEYTIVPFSPAYMAPPGISEDQKDVLGESLIAACENPDFETKAKESGLDVLSIGPDEFETTVDDLIPIVESYVQSANE